ncbi:MAG: hypothetical protein QXL17_04265 [Candidatus Thermoplasmatota archaeon]
MPMYLTVALIVAAVIIATFTIGIYNMITTSQAHAIEYELSKIVAEAEHMYQYADEGSMVTVDVTFPATLKYAVFGSTPLPGGQEPTNRQLNPATANNYYYVLSDGTVSPFHSPVCFSSEDPTKFAVVYAGNYRMCLELKKIGAVSYVSIYPQ